ncbi:ANTAR domain-containing protein [Blastococcus sp. SYSU D01042]
MTDPLGILGDELQHLHDELGMAHQQVAQLETGLLSNRRIGIAIGVVMERYKLSADEAFGVLQRLSQERNEKLRAIAERIVDTGELPGA